MIVCRMKQRNVDLNLAPDPADAALQHIVDAYVRNGVAQSRLSTVTEAGVGTEDEHVPKTDQFADHFLSHTVGKNILRRIAAVIRERQNHKRGTLYGGCPHILRNPCLEQKSGAP